MTSYLSDIGLFLQLTKGTTRYARAGIPHMDVIVLSFRFRFKRTNRQEMFHTVFALLSSVTENVTYEWKAAGGKDVSYLFKVRIVTPTENYDADPY